METEQLDCPLCRRTSPSKKIDGGGVDRWEIKCDTCKPYRVIYPLFKYLVSGKVADEDIPVVKALRDKFAQRSVSPDQDLVELSFGNWKVIAQGDEVSRISRS